MSSAGQTVTDTVDIDSVYNQLMQMQRSIQTNDCHQDIKDIENALDIMDEILQELQELYAKEEVGDGQ